MKCPFCDNKTTKVLETRETEPDITRRRRECTKCKERFTTYEQPELSNLVVNKRDGTREVFDKSKLVRSLKLCCQKRPITQQEILDLTDTIEKKLKSNYKKMVKSKHIGEQVMKKLKNLDNVAYIRYASVCRDFQDLETFEKEVKNLKKHKTEDIA